MKMVRGTFFAPFWVYTMHMTETHPSEASSVPLFFAGSFAHVRKLWGRVIRRFARIFDVTNIARRVAVEGVAQWNHHCLRVVGSNPCCCRPVLAACVSILGVMMLSSLPNARCIPYAISFKNTVSTTPCVNCTCFSGCRFSDHGWGICAEGVFGFAWKESL